MKNCTHCRSRSPFRVMCLISCIAFLLVPLTGSAQIVAVDWGGEMVTVSTDLNLGTATTVDDTRGYAQHSSTLSPTSGYTGTPFYGAIQNTVSTGAIDFASASVINATPDMFMVNSGFADGAGTTSSMRGLMYFKKADFANGLDSTPSLALTNTTGALKFTIEQFQANVSGRSVRFAILDSGNWYLSEAASTTNPTLGDPPLIFTLDNPASANWGLWSTSATPTIELDGPPGSGSFTIVGSTFGDIQAVGFFFDGAQSGTNPNTRLRISEFEAALIPEPSAAMLLLLVGGAVALGSLVRRRRLT